jgi:hypothetical protein
MTLSMLRAVRFVGFAVLVALSFLASGGSWAQQREARLLIGPRSERPIILVSCKAAELAQCKAAVTSQCGADKACADLGVTRCEAMCELQK